MLLLNENFHTGSQQANYSTDCDFRSEGYLHSQFRWQYLYPFMPAAQIQHWLSDVVEYSYVLNVFITVTEIIWFLCSIFLNYCAVCCGLWYQLGLAAIATLSHCLQYTVKFINYFGVKIAARYVTFVTRFIYHLPVPHFHCISVLRGLLYAFKLRIICNCLV